MFWQDLRHGARVFARNPALTSICVVSIAFGTGANVAIFSMADALLLRPLPVARPGELLTVGSRVLRGTVYQNTASYPDYVDIRDRARSFDGLVAFCYEPVALGGRAGEPPRVRFATFVSTNFFEVLGVAPQAGRGFLPEEDGAGGRGAVAILTDNLWRAEFGADPAVIGRAVRIGGTPFTVVGVAPASFTGLHPYIRDSVFVPVGLLPHVVSLPRPDALEARDVRILTVKGRLARGATPADARAELATIARDLERAHPETNKRLTIVALTEFAYRYEARPLDSSLLVVLTVLSIAVLSVACANVAGLLASRAPVRAREMALRLAIGAGRPRLIRQLITESLGIALAGAIGGLAVARAGIALLRQIRFPSDLLAPPVFELDERTLFFSVAVAAASALLVGLGPAVQTTRIDLVSGLKAGDRSGAGRQRLTTRSTLVALQVALSLVLITIAVFTVQVFSHELTKGPGFRTTGIAKITIDPAQARYEPAEAARFFGRVLDEARALPGVQSASLTSAMPLFSYQFTRIAVEGQPLPDGESGVSVWANSIDERFFQTMAIPIVSGRAFGDADGAGALPVAIVNDTLARHYWPDRDPIGARVQLLDSENDRPLVTIVGVVRTTTLGFPGEVPQQAMYFPYRQRPRGQMVLLAQTAGDSAAMVQPLRDLVPRLDAGVPAFDAQTMEIFYDARVTAIGNVLVRLVVTMGLMGLALTTIGLYGLVSYSVSRRTREIGIRIAIGATGTRIVNMVLRQGMRPAWLGLAAGIALSLLTDRLMSRLVPFGHRMDARTYYVVIPLVIAVTLVAAFVPARRAARVSPTEALRCE